MEVERSLGDPVPPIDNLEPSLENYSGLESISHARRRFSVDGNEAHLDGLATMDLPFEEPSFVQPEEGTFRGVYAGKSQKGFMPYNPRKVNQDWMLIREDSATETLVLGTFDGHGEFGHCISEVLLVCFP